jgi:hypothetical protein
MAALLSFSGPMAEILAVFERSHALVATLAAALDADGVAMLTTADHDLVRKRLFGSALPAHGLSG